MSIDTYCNLLDDVARLSEKLKTVQAEHSGVEHHEFSYAIDACKQIISTLDKVNEWRKHREKRAKP